MIPCFHMHSAFVRRRYLFCTPRLRLHKKNKFEIQSSILKRNLHKMHLGHVLVWRGVVKRNDDINKKCFQCSVVTSCFRVAARSCVPSLRLRHSRQREYLLLLLTWDKKIFCSDKNAKNIQGGFFNWSAWFSVPKWKTSCSQPGLVFHEIFNVKKLLVGWASFFILVLKIRRTS